MQLNPLHIKISALLEGRLFRIPQYQRAYSWRSSQRNDLFSDIEEANRSGREHFMATLVALARETREIGVDEFKAVELVDGQQRITTLVILLKAIEKALDVNDPKERKVKAELAELLVKGDDHSLILLQTNHDSSDVFLSYIRDGVIKASKATTAADNNLVDAATECELFVKKWQENGKSILNLVSTIKNRLSIIYHELADEATVYRVFEVLNSRGLDVKWIDKLKSQLMALIFENAEESTRDEAVREMQVVWQNIYRALKKETKIGDEALRFAGTWAATNRPNRIVSEEDATSNLVSTAGKRLKSIAEVGRKVEAVVEANLELFKDARLSAVTRIAHARFVAAAILLKDFPQTDKVELLKKWERVTFRIFELGGADTRHKVGEYVRLGYDIHHKNIDKPSIIARLNEISIGYSIDEVMKEIDWSDCYTNWSEQLRYLMYRYDEYLCKKGKQKINESQWIKIWDQDPSRSIEHIQPQSSEQSYVHHLGNLVMLPPGVNSSLSDKSPVEKAKTYKSCGLAGTMAIGEFILQNRKWNGQMVKKRAGEIESFIREEWGD